MWCVIKISIFIAAAFDWKASHEPSLTQPIDHNTDKGPHHLTETDIELTLSKRPVWVPYKPVKGWMSHERALADDAFQGHTCPFRLEQGVFQKPYPDGHNYAFRMVFDQSPYPSPETWQLHDQTYAMDVAEWKEFHSGDLARTMINLGFEIIVL